MAIMFLVVAGVFGAGASIVLFWVFRELRRIETEIEQDRRRFWFRSDADE